MAKGPKTRGARNLGGPNSTRRIKQKTNKEKELKRLKATAYEKARNISAGRAPLQRSTKSNKRKK